MPLTDSNNRGTSSPSSSSFMAQLMATLLGAHHSLHTEALGSQAGVLFTLIASLLLGRGVGGVYSGAFYPHIPQCPPCAPGLSAVAWRQQQRFTFDSLIRVAMTKPDKGWGRGLKQQTSLSLEFWGLGEQDPGVVRAGSFKGPAPGLGHDHLLTVPTCSSLCECLCISSHEDTSRAGSGPTLMTPF